MTSDNSPRSFAPTFTIDNTIIFEEKKGNAKVRSTVGTWWNSSKYLEVFFFIISALLHSFEDFVPAPNLELACAVILQNCDSDYLQVIARRRSRCYWVMLFKVYYHIMSDQDRKVQSHHQTYRVQVNRRVPPA